LAETIYFEFIHRLFRSLIIIYITSGFYNLVSTSSEFLQDFSKKYDGHFLLTNRLLDMIIASAPARIINVSSGAHKAGRIYFDDVNLTKNFSMFRAYGQSKLANILFTIELAERLQGTGVSVNSLHPGFVGTGIGVNRETGFGRLISKMLTFISLTPEQGAETSVYLAATVGGGGRDRPVLL
jgi:NAD(P)-dependent dehydrogenase (short-subunit alcohol dehydrogenase family)